jgi:hypothetical protein
MRTRESFPPEGIASDSPSRVPASALIIHVLLNARRNRIHAQIVFIPFNASN